MRKQLFQLFCEAIILNNGRYIRDMLGGVRVWLPDIRYIPPQGPDASTNRDVVITIPYRHTGT